MAWSDDTYITSFDAEAGDISTLATAAQKIIWFNEAQARLLRRKPLTDDITWLAADRTVALNADFVQMDKIVWSDGSSAEPWRVWGENLIIDDEDGASASGGARVYYWGEWTEMTTATTATDLSLSQDYTCLYYALSRFYRKLSSNRAYYKRYATLVGQNAISMSDLQQEADRYYQDFLDAREDFEPNPPAYFYDTY
jgi:hypothetical protein